MRYYNGGGTRGSVLAPPHHPNLAPGVDRSDAVRHADGFLWTRSCEDGSVVFPPFCVLVLARPLASRLLVRTHLLVHPDQLLLVLGAARSVNLADSHVTLASLVSRQPTSWPEQQAGKPLPSAKHPWEAAARPGVAGAGVGQLKLRPEAPARSPALRDQPREAVSEAAACSTRRRGPTGRGGRWRRRRAAPRASRPAPSPALRYAPAADRP